ncbi:facilitated trehalose transporter Tret1-like isoform X2 [Sipha flava]|nr:facilitated trehalose transporter Tret1-like isoform X2 [Sipha flava]
MSRENERLIGEDEAERAKSCYRQLLAAFLASLMSLSSGTVIAGWSPSGGHPNDVDLNMWTEDQESWVIAIYVLGALVGALPSGRLSRRYGRKKYLIWLAFPMIAGWLICLLYSNSLVLECVGRFFCGLSVGATTVAVPLYASDVSSDVLRGRTGVFFDFMLCAGILYAYVARALLNSLRDFIKVCVLVPITFVAVFSCMPESPVHLFEKGQYEQATTTFRWLRGRRFNVNQEFEKIERSRFDFKVSTECGENKIGNNKKFWWKVIFITFGLVFAQRMSGAGAIIQYSDSLFEMSASNIPPDAACVIIGVFQLAGSGLSFFLIDKIGRRTLLLISSGVITICLMMLTIYFKLSNSGALDNSPWKISVLFILCTFIVAFRLGLGPIPWFISTELIPTENGGLPSVAATFSWTLSFVIMKTFKMIVDSSPIALWATFAALSVIGFIFILFYVPETNNKSREEIRINLTCR